MFIIQDYTVVADFYNVSSPAKTTLFISFYYFLAWFWVMQREYNVERESVNLSYIYDVNMIKKTDMLVLICIYLNIILGVLYIAHNFILCTV